MEETGKILRMIKMGTKIHEIKIVNLYSWNTTGLKNGRQTTFRSYEHAEEHHW